MIRSILVDAGEGRRTVLQARLDHEMTQDEFLARIGETLAEFKAADPEKYAKCLESGMFPWPRLFTHVPQHMLERRGVDLMDCSDVWLRLNTDKVL